MRAFARTLTGGVLGTAAWFSLGVVALPPADSPHFVVGLLPPFWALLALFCAGVALAVLGRTISTALLLLPAIAVLPWLGARLPAGMLWSGPFVLLLWMLVSIAIARSLGLHRWLTSFTGLTVSAALVIATFAVFATRTGVSGDEPHYLLITQSVIEDGDFDLANNYEPPRYRSFYPGVLQPRHTVFSKSRREYSFHGVGVPLLVLPGFAVAGVAGARVLLGLVTLAGVVALWRCIRQLTSDSAAATVGVAALLFQLPFLAQAASIYPDGAAAALITTALRALITLEQRSDVTRARLLGVGAALALLPWMHVRLAWIAAVFGIAIVAVLLRRRSFVSHVLPFLAIPAMSAGLFFAMSLVLFGTIDVTAAFRQKAAGTLSGLPVGTVGLLFDREYGLFVYAPAMIFGVIGWRALQRQASLTAWTSLIITLGTLFVSASFVWWAGTSAPARFLVPVLPMFALSVGAWWPRATSLARGSCIAAILAGAVLATLAAWADRGLYVTNEPDGQLTIFDWANRLVNIQAALPSFVRPIPSLNTELALIAAFVISGAIIAWCARALSRPARFRLDAWTVASCAMVILASVSATAAWAIRRVDPVTSNRSQLNLLLASDCKWLTTSWIDGRPAEDQDAVLRALAVESSDTADPRTLLHVPYPPAGRYRIEVTAPDSGRPLGGSLTLAADREGNRLWVWPLGSPQEAPSITTVAPVHSLRVIASETAAAEHVRVRLRALGRNGLPYIAPARAEQVARFADTLVYFLDGGVSVETGGFWAAANRPTRVLCTTLDGSRGCDELSLEAGDQMVRVRFSQRDWTSEVSLDARATANLKLPTTAIQPLAIEASGTNAGRAVFVSVPRR